MKILFGITDAQIARCFRVQDLTRLRAAGHDLINPGATTRPEIVEAIQREGSTSDIWITGWGTPPLDTLITPETRLQAVIHAAGSIKGLKPEPALAQGIRFASCNQALAIGVAETSLGMIISGLKGLFFAREWTSADGWSGNWSFNRPFFKVRELFDITIGIVGASKVGKHLVKLLQAFEVNVLIYDPFLDEAGAQKLGARKVDLETLFAKSDVISVHAPLLPETKGIVSAPLIRSMKDNSILINTARGVLIDEAALIAELETERISAILDVTEVEPPAADHPLRKLRNVVLTPHLAGAVNNGCHRIGREAVQHVLDFASGKTMEGEVQSHQLAQLA